MSVLGALSEGRNVPAVTIFGWDDVLCPTTHARQERAKRTAQVFGVPMPSSKEHKREVSYQGSDDHVIIQTRPLKIKCLFGNFCDVTSCIIEGGCLPAQVHNLNFIQSGYSR